MKKKIFSVTLATLGVAIIFFSFSEVVMASQTASRNGITVTLDASRPLVGNPRGSSYVCSNRDHNNNGMRVRTRVDNSNNTTTVATSNEWRTVTASSTSNLIPLACSHHTATITGTTRSGTVRGRGERCSRNSTTWNGAITASRSW